MPDFKMPAVGDSVIVTTYTIHNGNNQHAGTVVKVHQEGEPPPPPDPRRPFRMVAVEVPGSLDIECPMENGPPMRCFGVMHATVTPKDREITYLPTWNWPDEIGK